MNNTNSYFPNLTSFEDLNLLLSKYPSIDTGTWVKSVSSLYKEIESGESILEIQSGELYRRVDIVAIKCFHTNNQGERFQLFEEKQVFKNGHTRQRGHTYVAEKLQAGESPEVGALRGLAEELQISGPGVIVIPLPEEKTHETKESLTYKGIKSIYNTYFFTCEISPAHYRNTYVEDQDDKLTYFKWLKI